LWWLQVRLLCVPEMCVWVAGHRRGAGRRVGNDTSTHAALPASGLLGKRIHLHLVSSAMLAEHQDLRLEGLQTALGLLAGASRALAIARCTIGLAP
jgi:hypothetical protein